VPAEGVLVRCLAVGVGAEPRLGSLILVGTVALGVILRIWPVVFVLYRDVFIGSLTELRLDAFVFRRSGF